MLREILGSEARIDILRLLITRPDWIFSLQELSAGIKRPKTTVWRNMNSLVENGILREFKKGGSTVYQLNQRNYIVMELLKPLFLSEAKLPIELAKRFCKQLHNMIKVAVVFGSAARGEMKPTSDIDIALITDRQIEHLLNRLRLDFLDKYGLIVSTHILPFKEYKQRYSAGDPFAREIANGKVIIGNLEEVM